MTTPDETSVLNYDHRASAIRAHVAPANVFSRLAVIALILATVLSSAARAELFINEIFNDPGGMGSDERDEYIELRGTPGMSLQNTYLIFIENEVNATGGGTAGWVENIFILGDDPNTATIETPYTIGSNGFLTLRQSGNLYSAPAEGTTDLVNTGNGVGWGSDSTSTVRHSGEAGKIKIENSGFTAMLIRNDGDPFLGQPFLGLDLDQGNDGLDPPESDQFDWRDNWTIIDSIGIHGEIDEANGRLYGMVNFGQEPTANTEPGTDYLGVGYEIELITRWGNSSGHTIADWHIANVSDRTVDGLFTASAGPPDFRQSGGFHDDPPMDFIESSQYVPYGTPLTTTLGAPNYPLNLERLPWDFNGDGTVDAADYVVWRKTVDQIGMDLAADGDGSGTVGEQDHAWWRARFGYSWSDVPGYVPLGSASTASSIPEATSIMLLAFNAITLSTFRIWTRADSRRPMGALRN